MNGLQRLFQRRNPIREQRVTLGLALGGGFARAMAHLGVLQVFEEEKIPIHYIAGVSAGSLVAAAFAGGSTSDEIARVGAALRFGDVARWTFSKLGFCCTDGMAKMLARLLKKNTFEEMRIPLAVGATDLQTGHPVVFSGAGDVRLPLRASCAFPGIFQPVRWNQQILTDGGISMEVPSSLVREMGATRVISVCIPHDSGTAEPANMVEVVSRSMQIMQMRNESSWRKSSDLVITPEVGGWGWHDFKSSTAMIAAGADAARKALPAIREWVKAA
jgi:NTE family protein